VSLYVVKKNCSSETKDADVTASASFSSYRHLYQLSGTSHINYGELRHIALKKRFSLPFITVVLVLNLFL